MDSAEPRWQSLCMYEYVHVCIYVDVEVSVSVFVASAHSLTRSLIVF